MDTIRSHHIHSEPNVAKKLIPRSFHDLGQGILDCIYEQNSILKNKL